MSESFTQLTTVVETVRRIKGLAYDRKDQLARFAPVTSPGDRRMTHLVLQGGGTLGIAHLGFMYGLEQAGFCFLGVAGTSAGAIIALLVVCARQTIDTQISEVLIPTLTGMPASTFVDGPYRTRRLIKWALSGSRTNASEYLLPALDSARRIAYRFGLNPGEAFQGWLTHELERLNVTSIAHLKKKLEGVAGSLSSYGFRGGDRASGGDGETLLRITATAMPLGIKMTFPEDMDVLDASYLERSPAIIARASMSVPLFFEPYQMQLNAINWKRRVDTYFKQIYDETTCRYLLEQRALSFIDGGLLSNFPIDSFLDYPARYGQNEQLMAFRVPTIGVGLVSGGDRGLSRPTGLRALAGYTAQVVTAMRHQRDREALMFSQRLTNRITDSTGRIRVGYVDVRGHNWLNFLLSDFEMKDLFDRGVSAAYRFLKLALGEEGKNDKK